MKLNAAVQLLPLSWSEFSNIHPFAPLNQARGYQIMFHELEEALCEITGFDAISLQPNSGAQGEYAGLMVIKEFHKKNGDELRNICFNMLYFSMSNTITMGYGDIYPLSYRAKVIVAIHMVCLFLVISLRI